MKVDIWIQQAKVYHTISKTFKTKDVTILDGKIYQVLEAGSQQIEATAIIDAKGQYLIPGLLDIHMHIESSMTTPAIFEKAALSYGVTTIVADAHEMANVFGLEGLNYFMQAKTTLDIFHAIPSSVPSTTPELETTGGYIGLAEVEKLLENPQVICLGEGMNFKGIAYEKDSLIRQIIALCRKKRPTMPLEGHCPKIVGEELAAFLSSGIDADHTHQFPDTMKERLESGVFIELQKKSLTKENMQVIKEGNYYEATSLVTDDVMADDLLQGHLNENVKLAIQCGLRPEDAIYIATYTPARRMGLHDRGIIAPGKLADFILLSDLENFTIEEVYKKGEPVHQKGQKISYPQTIEKFPDDYYASIHCKKLVPEDLILKVKTTKKAVRCNFIQKQTVGTFTKRITKEIPVKDGRLDYQAAGCALLVVMERYGKNGNISLSLMNAPIQEKGAIGTTWAHDHHNLMVMGTNPEEIIQAQEELLKLNGGYVVTKEQQVVATCPLPLGGILSQEPLEILGQQLKEVRKAMQSLGYENQNEIMSFSTLSLPVSPAIKVTDKGMMNTQTQEFYPLIFPEDGVLI